MAKRKRKKSTENSGFLFEWRRATEHTDGRQTERKRRNWKTVNWRLNCNQSIMQIDACAQLSHQTKLHCNAPNVRNRGGKGASDLAVYQRETRYGGDGVQRQEKEIVKIQTIEKNLIYVGNRTVREKVKKKGKSLRRVQFWIQSSNGDACNCRWLLPSHAWMAQLAISIEHSRSTAWIEARARASHTFLAINWLMHDFFFWRQQLQLPSISFLIIFGFFSISHHGCISAW